MTDLTVRRVIITCDAVCDIGSAVEEAGALAARWHAALHGVFLEDENLFRLAALPFGRQVSLSSVAVSESFAAADLENLSSVLGGAMRRAIAQVAARRGLEWSFGTVRDFPTVAALARVEGDLLIVEGAARPFSGSWRPRSAWDALAKEPARTMLIRRERPLGPGRVLVLIGKGADCERTLGAGFAMAEAENEIVILVQDDAEVEVETVQGIASRLAVERAREFRLQRVSSERSALLGSVQRFNPALIVLDPGQADGDAIRALLAGTRCDVLLMR